MYSFPYVGRITYLLHKFDTKDVPPKIGTPFEHYKSQNVSRLARRRNNDDDDDNGTTPAMSTQMGVAILCVSFENYRQARSVYEMEPNATNMYSLTNAYKWGEAPWLFGWV